MADYSEQMQSAYESIADKGGAIIFKQPAQDTTPADPDAPWEGNAEDPADFTHVAVLLPLSAQPQNAESNHRILIPALKLPFTPQMGQAFEDDKGTTYSLTAITRLAPDPAQVILFDCECAVWPGT
jgi:hypothetical protein